MKSAVLFLTICFTSFILHNLFYGITKIEEPFFFSLTLTSFVLSASIFSIILAKKVRKGVKI